MKDKLITKDTKVLDFGCGRNNDVRLLCAEGIAAIGWDRYFTPHAPIEAADVVLSNFVINTIEYPPERESYLLMAYALTRSVLVAAVRTDNRGWKGKTESYGDGTITTNDTFQKIYIHDEFCQYVADILEKPAHAVKSGIVYVFRDTKLEEDYLTQHPSRRYKV